MKIKAWFVSRVKVQRVSPVFLLRVIERRIPYGLFLTMEKRCWVAVDNSTGDAWTEEFAKKRQAISWLRGEFEVGEASKSWDWVDAAEKLVAAAARQGLAISIDEANLMLGYLEGHEYSLMVDAVGTTVRHDDQYGCKHRGDEPYTVRDVIAFCQEMNEDLLRENSFSSEQNVEYLAQLRKDEQALGALMERAISQEGEFWHLL